MNVDSKIWLEVMPDIVVVPALDQSEFRAKGSLRKVIEL